jgi:hypothetical protein
VFEFWEEVYLSKSDGILVAITIAPTMMEYQKFKMVALKRLFNLDDVSLDEVKIVYRIISLAGAVT